MFAKKRLEKVLSKSKLLSSGSDGAIEGESSSNRGPGDVDGGGSSSHTPSSSVSTKSRFSGSVKGSQSVPSSKHQAKLGRPNSLKRTSPVNAGDVNSSSSRQGSSDNASSGGGSSGGRSSEDGSQFSSSLGVSPTNSDSSEMRMQTNSRGWIRGNTGPVVRASPPTPPPNKRSTEVDIKNIRKENTNMVIREGARAEKKRRVSVQFSNVEIREYERVVGDNPSCSSGPPIR
jgi:hypothetical protein